MLHSVQNVYFSVYEIYWMISSEFIVQFNEFKRQIMFENRRIEYVVRLEMRWKLILSFALPGLHSRFFFFWILLFMDSLRLIKFWCLNEKKIYFVLLSVQCEISSSNSWTIVIDKEKFTEKKYSSINKVSRLMHLKWWKERKNNSK